MSYLPQLELGLPICRVKLVLLAIIILPVHSDVIPSQRASYERGVGPMLLPSSYHEQYEHHIQDGRFIIFCSKKPKHLVKLLCLGKNAQLSTI